MLSPHPLFDILPGRSLPDLPMGAVVWEGQQVYESHLLNLFCA